MADPATTVDQNLLPVQAYFDVFGNFQTFIGQGMPFYATLNPVQSGLTITNSTINSTTIGALVPSTGVFTDIQTTTGRILTSPVATTDLVNKAYVDAVAQGLGPKAACEAGTTVNLASLSGLLVIDTYQTVVGDRILVKNQTASEQNGIYIASVGAWSRSPDLDNWSEVRGAYTVLLGGTQLDTGWVCIASNTGTIGVTAMPWVQFASNSTYFAGTGLSLNANTFSITPIGTAGTYGSASAVPVFVTNASGQVTSVTNTSIAIANTQVSGLGTMSTQNANAVAITGGSIDGTSVGLTTASTVRGTTVTADTQFSGPGTGLTGTATSLNIGGNAATATSATSAGSVTNSVTFANTGGAVSGTTYNGSVARTIDYSTLGAPSASGTGASGTWNIGITGNSGTVTNGVYTNGSYSNPTWITSILGSIVSGAVANATLATTATNVAGGTTGSIVYQSALATTTTLALGTTNYVLTAGASAPQYVAQSTLSVGSATNATNATYLAGGSAGVVPYQSGVGVTAFTAVGSAGQVLTSQGAGTPTWTTPTAYATVTDDTTTAGTRYPLFANQTAGNLATSYTSSTKYQYNPSTGVLTATGFSGSGASLTSLTAGNLSGTIPSAVLGNSTLYIGTTAVLLNAASGSITSLAVNISGSATSATTATTATNATNVAVTDNTSSTATWYPTVVSTTTGNLPITTSSTKLSFVPSTGILTATGFAGALNGTVGASTPATGTFTSLSNSGNLTFTGTGNRITGDMSSVPASRVVFQTSTTNGVTSITTFPNGTETESRIEFFNNSNSTDASFLRIGTTATASYIQSTRNSALGTFLPITILTSNAERMRIFTSGGVSIGNTTDPGNTNLRVTGSVTALGAVSGTNITASGSLLWGSGGTYAAGCIYADANWGAIIRAKTASPVQAIFRFADSADVEVMRVAPSGGVNIGAITDPGATNLNVNGVITTGSNVGVGITPSAWSGFRALQIGGTTSLWSSTSGNASSFYTNNGYYNGSNRIYLTTGFASEYIMGAGSHYWYTAPTGTAGNAITFTQAMTLDNSGNLLIGATTSSRRLFATHAVSNFTAGIGNTGTTPYGLYMEYSATPNSTGSEFIFATDTGGATLRFSVRSNGGIANYATNNVVLSDNREKTNFAPATSYLNKICAIPVQTFNYIDENLKDGGLTLGVVAQDVQAIAPELVTEGNWGTKEKPKMRLEIYQTDLQYALMKCIQEQQTLIENLTTRLTVLENK